MTSRLLSTSIVIIAGRFILEVLLVITETIVLVVIVVGVEPIIFIFILVMVGFRSICRDILDQLGDLSLTRKRGHSGRRLGLLAFPIVVIFISIIVSLGFIIMVGTIFLDMFAFNVKLISLFALRGTPKSVKLWCSLRLFLGSGRCNILLRQILSLGIIGAVFLGLTH